MLRSIGAIAVGYLAYILLSGIGGFALVMSFPEVVSQTPQNPGTGFLVAGLVLGILFAGVGGYITAVIAKTAEVRHALSLGGVIVLLGLVSIIAMSTPQPLWSQLLGLIFAVPSVYLGGRLRAKQSTRREVVGQPSV